MMREIVKPERDRRMNWINIPDGWNLSIKNLVNLYEKKKKKHRLENYDE